MSLVVIKQPGEKLLVAIDFVDKFGDTALSISSVNSLTATKFGIIPGASDVNLTGQNVVTPEVRVFVDGGTDGEDYKIRCTVTDNVGQIHEADGTVRVIEV